MTIECYKGNCDFHAPDGPWCDEDECHEPPPLNPMPRDKKSVVVEEDDGYTD